MVVTPATRRALIVVTLSVAACGRDRSPAPTPDSAASAAAPGSVNVDASAGSCPATGHWSPCQARYRLQRSGLAPRDSSADDLPALGPTPAVYIVGTSVLAVYIFADSAARRRSAAALDSTKFVAPSSPLSMRGEATAIQNDNLLALLYSRRDLQRERISDALTAGPPQP